MPRLQLDRDVTSLSEFRAGVAGCVQRVRESHRPLLLTQHGKGVAVLLDVAAYEALLERQEVLEDIRISEEQAARGQVLSHSAAKAQVLKRLRK